MQAYHLHYAVMQQRCLYIIVYLNLGVVNKQISKSTEQRKQKVKKRKIVKNKLTGIINDLMV